MLLSITFGCSNIVWLSQPSSNIIQNTSHDYQKQNRISLRCEKCQKRPVGRDLRHKICPLCENNFSSSSAYKICDKCALKHKKCKMCIGPLK